MSRVATLPYRRPLATRVETEPWQLIEDGQSRTLPALLEHWDSTVSLELSRTVRLDYEALLKDIDLPSGTLIRIAATWYASGASLRGGKRIIDLTDGSAQPLQLHLHIPGRLLGGRLALETQVVLGAEAVTAPPLAPHRAGSLLWRDQQSLLLEGRAARFPTMVLDFTTTRFPANAVWYLDWDRDDLQQPALGSMCLLLNARHPAVSRGIVKVHYPGKTFGNLWDAILYEVQRELFEGAFRNDDFAADPHAFEEGSVGAYIRRRLVVLFPGEDISSLRQHWLDRPAEFACLLQDRLRLFRER